MSRIGKKPIPLPQGVKFEVKGNTVVVQGPKGQVQTHLPAGVELKQADGNIQVTRKDDNHAAVHGLARAENHFGWGWFWDQWGAVRGSAEGSDER